MTTASAIRNPVQQDIYSERRNLRAPDFTLVQLDPRDVIEGIMIQEGYQSEDAPSAGSMREHCPYCSGVQLQLILRYKFVKRSHLLCTSCTRCYDALYPDGTSALALGAMSLV
ncbi:hypothetical protein H8L32_18725 [Undibacterium sp. CY18W]|uniref:Uncharacterized protein n=1 Tax=Undibacterium hunanense TaxID=2762292 RepID=A0ABR6ZUG5_9BURK|nr:hypothetical protein [Undibacterium hunanense]MBC3919528.1 hypothetical protein [Undibacterium hunanense]